MDTFGDPWKFGFSDPKDEGVLLKKMSLFILHYCRVKLKGNVKLTFDALAILVYLHL